jgi:hypothetical protein
MHPDSIEGLLHNTCSLVYVARLPWSMITDNRIFSRNFAVYGRLR